MSAARRKRGREANPPRIAGAAPRGPSPSPPRAQGAPGRSDAWLEVAIVLACMAFAIWVERRALAGFFSLDDLVIMEEARGLRAATPGLWRLLSRHLYFGATVPMFGAHPLPYHLVSMFVHAANIGLLYVWVRSRSGSLLAATVGAGLFGASRLHMTALGSAATIGEPLALTFTLGAFLLHDRGVRGRVGAAALFALALLSKESVVLLPLVLLWPRRGGPMLRERLVNAAPMLALGALFAVALALSGAGSAQLGGQAYERAFGSNLVMNLMTYTRWVAHPLDAFPGQVSAFDAGDWPIGIAATLALGALAWLGRRAAFPPVLGCRWWLLALAPVLPLLHHTYLYYLYIPFAGVAMVMAGTAGWVEEWAAGTSRSGDRGKGAPVRRRTGGALQVVRGVAIALVIAHGLHADRLLTVRYAAHMPGTGIPLDPDLRKSEMARHAVQGVTRQLSGRHARVAFLVPASLADVYSTATGQRLGRAAADSGTYILLAGALDDGRGLRALMPNVDSVAFLSAWRPGYGGFEMFSQGSDGTVYPQGRGAEGYAAAAAAMIGGGAIEPARQFLAGALSEFPDDAPLRYQYARSFYASGDSLGMRRELEELVRRAPNHPLAARVREAFPAPAPRK